MQVTEFPVQNKFKVWRAYCGCDKMTICKAKLVVSFCLDFKNGSAGAFSTSLNNSIRQFNIHTVKKPALY